MTMRFDFADFSRRFSLNDILRPMSIAEQRQAEIDRQKAAYFARGATITVCPPPVYRPKVEAVRKPHPEARAKPGQERPVKLSKRRDIPEGMLCISEAAHRCGLNKKTNRHMKVIRDAVERGLILPDHAVSRGSQTLYYFRAETCDVFLKVMGPKWWLPKKDKTKTYIKKETMLFILEKRRQNTPWRTIYELTGHSIDTMKNGIKLVEQFGMDACR